MKTFTKWFLVNAIVFTAVYFAQTRDALTTIVENDISKLSVLIMSLYVLMSVYVGRLCYLSDKMSKSKPETRRREKDYLLKRAGIGWFAAEHFFSLGLLGTIFGLCVATSTNLNASAPLSEIVAGLKSGLNTAFYTTICGIVCSLPLQVQLMILDFGVNRRPSRGDDEKKWLATIEAAKKRIEELGKEKPE